MSDSQSSDRVEQQIQLDNPRARVWRALSDSKQFGQWFGVNFEAPFESGKEIHGRLTVKGYENLDFTFWVEKIEPERFFSFRWHPYAIDPNVDYSGEPTTLVAFTLEDSNGGTLLKVVETGFDDIPAARRVKAWEMNNKGWTSQNKNIQKYLLANA